jgi:hypothetical protein
MGRGEEEEEAYERTWEKNTKKNERKKFFKYKVKIRK